MAAEDAQNVYELREKRTKYANKYIILVDNPVPCNIDKPRKMDELFKELLEKKRKIWS